MAEYRVSAEIAAPIEEVWRILTEQMPREPERFGIVKFEGTLSSGARIKLWSEVDPNRAFVLRVDAFERPRRMVWRGGLPFGLFTGTRTFVLSPSANGTRFDMHEVFTGALAGLITKSMPDLTPSFEKFCNELKERAETDG